MRNPLRVAYAEVMSRVATRAAMTHVRLQLMTMKKGGGLFDELFKRGLERLLTSTDVINPFREVDTIYVAVSRIARYGSSVPWGLFRGDTPVEDPEHAFYKLMAKPNELMTTEQLFEATLEHLELRGACFWLPDEFTRLDKRADTKFPARLRILDANKVKPRKKGEELEGWDYTQPSGTPKPYGVKDLIKFSYVDPDDPFGWLAPLTAARLGYNISWKANKWQEQFYQNGGVPPFWMYTPEDVIIDDSEIEKLRQQFKDKFLGLKNAGTPPILFKGAELRSLSVTQRDSEWVLTTKMSREQVLAVYDVPPAIAGVFEYANYANSSEQKRYFWLGTLPPKCQLLKSIINATLVKPFWPDLEFRWKWPEKLAQVVPEDIREGVKAARGLVEIGVPPSEAFRITGIPVDARGKAWLDEGYMVFNLVPVKMLDQAHSQPTGAAPDGGDQNTSSDGDSGKKTLELPGPGWNDAIRAVLRRRYEVVLNRLEDRFLRDYRGFLNWLREQMIGKVKSMKDFALGSDAMAEAILKASEDEWIPEVVKVMQQVKDRTRAALLASIETGGQMAVDEMGLGISFDMLDPEIVRLLMNRQIQIVGAVGNLLDEIRSQVRTGIELGESVIDISFRVRTVMDEYYTGQALTVARTETAAAFNGGRIIAMLKAGITKVHWLSARDERVRKSHKDLDGTSVPLGTPFPNGCRWPHDERGSAEEVVNCRCVPLPEV